MSKGFATFFRLMDADVFAVQETKMQEDQKDFRFDNYHEYWNSAERKGYSGTLIYTKTAPESVVYGIDGQGYNDEGRIITLTYPKFHFVNVYVPNSQEGLARLDYRMEFEETFRAYLKRLDSDRPVILTGDLNVAHTEIDLKNPKANEKNAGYSVAERTKFAHLLDAGFTDTYRRLYPERVQYTWWSYMFNARKNNAGWRIDYFLVSNRIMDAVRDSVILDDISGSDHCPVMLEIDM